MQKDPVDYHTRDSVNHRKIPADCDDSLIRGWLASSHLLAAYNVGGEAWGRILYEV